MNETTVVDVRCDEFDDYIGRPAPTSLDERVAAGSEFANPYRVTQYGRCLALEKYEKLWRWRVHNADPTVRAFWRARLETLRGRRIACWCKKFSLPCHGDILVKLLAEIGD